LERVDAKVSKLKLRGKR